METENVETVTQPDVAVETPAIEPAVEPAIEPVVEETPAVEPVVETIPEVAPVIEPVVEVAPIAQTPTYQLVGTETRLKVTELDTATRNTLAMESATIAAQIAALQTQRNTIITQFNTQLQTIDQQIATLRAQSDIKAAQSVAGRISESVVCDIYESATERISLPTGTDPTERAEILAVTDLTVRS
jgi:hypothetical protein